MIGEGLRGVLVFQLQQTSYIKKATPAKRQLVMYIPPRAKVAPSLHPRDRFLGRGGESEGGSCRVSLEG